MPSDLDAASEAIVEAHFDAKHRLRGRSYKPELLTKLASRPDRDEGAIDYSVTGGPEEPTAPGSYAGDFGGGGTGHDTDVQYAPGQTDADSGRYAERSVGDLLHAAFGESAERVEVDIRRFVKRAILQAKMRSARERAVREAAAKSSERTLAVHADHLLISVSGDRVRAVCESCGRVGEGPITAGLIPMQHDETCRFEFCKVCNGRLVERGSECDHREVVVEHWYVRGDGAWAKRRGRRSNEEVMEAIR